MNEKVLDNGWIVSGMPTKDRLEQVAEGGGLVISLCNESEESGPEAYIVNMKGGRFVRVPVSPPLLDIPGYRQKIYDVFEMAGAYDKVFIHCATSNRVGAALALYHWERLKEPVDKSIEYGVSAGMQEGLKGFIKSIMS